MEFVLTRDQVRQVDQIAIDQFGIPGVVLMENAGRGCVEQLSKHGVAGPVVICCGPGNNGGDGYVIARHLDNAGISVKVLLVGSPEKIIGDAQVNFEIIQKMDIPIVPLDKLDAEFWRRELEFVEGNQTEWIVDALLGTGASGPPRSPMDKLIQQINSVAAKRMAIDIPTGIDCDTGVCHEPTFSADVTCTFVARKPAFENKTASLQCGVVAVIDIGVPVSVIHRVNEK